MTTLNRLWGVLPALTIIGGLTTASVAMAQSASSASESMGATTGLGTHHRFPTVAAAQAHCPRRHDRLVERQGAHLPHGVRLLRDGKPRLLCMQDGSRQRRVPSGRLNRRRQLRPGVKRRGLSTGQASSAAISASTIASVAA